MAKKKTKNIDPEIAPLPKKSEIVRLLSGLFFFGMALYTFVALLSYLFTWAQDQSILHKGDIWTTIVDAENDGGMIGFLWANFLFSKLFGLGAFIIPFFFASLSLFFLKLKRVNLVKVFYVTIYGAIILSVLFSFIFGFTKFDDWFGSGVGGSYGYHVNNWLVAMLGPIGAGSLIFVLFIGWLIIVNRRVLIKINGAIVSLYNKISLPRKREKAVEKKVDDSAEANSAVLGDNGADEKLEDSLEEEVITTSLSSDVDMDEVKSKLSAEPTFEIIDYSQQESLEQNDDTNLAGDMLQTEELPEIEVIDDDSQLDSEDVELRNLPKESLDALFDPRLDLSHYKAPSLALLDDYKDSIYKVPHDELEKNNRKIVKTLNDYKITIERIFARTGPTVTLYEIVPSAGIRISQIKRLEDDIALSLAARGVRIIAPIPGTNTVGIEVANDKPSIVPMKSVLEDPKFRNSSFDLPIVLGRTISNEAMTFDLAKMPHLLVAGATGQGKSVGLNAIITSLLYTKHPSEVKFVLIDPKKVELSLYSKLERHFLAKLPDSEDAIITDTQKVIYTLKSLTLEMDSRYDLLKAAQVRNVKEYNEKFLNRRLNPLKGHKYMNYIVVIIDEFADLLMTAGREIEEPIVRLAQLARAIGIHLVIATQRPTTNVITGLIKANFPARIAFRVISNIDSRTILETTGANQLVGRGDMLVSLSGELTRVQCAFVDTAEVERVTDFIANQQGYATAHYLPEYNGEDGGALSANEVDLSKRDKLFEEAARLIVQYQQGSTSFIQRRLNLGYNRAGRIMDQLHQAGIVGPQDGSKPRELYITDMISLENMLKSLDHR